MDLTDNVGYGVVFGTHPVYTYTDDTYDQVGSRRNAIYGGDAQDIKEMESYNIYDIVL